MRANISLSAAFLFTLGFSAPSMAEKIYKWTDEKGQVNYSQQNPQNQKTTIIESNNKASGVEGLTPEMQKQLKDMEEKAKKEQAAKAEETNTTQIEPKNPPYIPSLPYGSAGSGPKVLDPTRLPVGVRLQGGY